MNAANLRTITNNFMDVKLLSLSSWRAASQIFPRDHGGPYVVTQEGFDPEDMTMKPDEFILGRSGRWLALGYFYQMPVPERRAEFVFGTAAEVMQMMYDLPNKPQMFRRDPSLKADAPIPEKDELAKAIQAAKEEVAAATKH